MLRDVAHVGELARQLRRKLHAKERAQILRRMREGDRIIHVHRYARGGREMVAVGWASGVEMALCPRRTGGEVTGRGRPHIAASSARLRVRVQGRPRRLDRRLGCGRPRAGAVARASTRSGDSGDPPLSSDDDSEPHRRLLTGGLATTALPGRRWRDDR